MKRFNSIKKNSEFQVVYKTGKSYANKLLIMYVTHTDRPENRIGISVSKKVGKQRVRFFFAIPGMFSFKQRAGKDWIRHRYSCQTGSKRIRF